MVILRFFIAFASFDMWWKNLNFAVYVPICLREQNRRNHEILKLFYMKKVLVIGGGGREHAIVDAIIRSPQVGKIY